MITEILWRLKTSWVWLLFTLGLSSNVSHFSKASLLRKSGKKFNLSTFVETGTYKARMIKSLAPHFAKIYSIELSSELVNRAREKFKGSSNIQIIEGDSGKVLPPLISQLKEGSLIFLDAHHSGGITAKADVNTPIISEINALKKTNINHVIVIDDLASFGTEGYPTVQWLKDALNNKYDTKPIFRNQMLLCTPKPS